MAESSAPPEAPGKLPWDRILAVVVVVVVVVAAWGWIFNPLGPAPPEEEEPPVNTAPTAVGSVDTTVGDIGDIFSFTGSGSSDPDADDSIASWEWNFGDGAVVREVADDGDDGNVKYVYSVTGEFVVVLTVTDTRNVSTNNDISLITVRTIHPNVPVGNGTSPLAILAADKTVINTDTKVSFNADSSWVWLWSWKNESNHSEGGSFDASFEDLSYSWSFGDGAAGTGNVTDHTFTRAGNYPVKLVATTDDGRKDVAIKTIRVLAPASPYAGVVKNSDSYVRAVIGEPDSLDPAKAYDTSSGFVLNQVVESLIWYDKEKTELIPWLATNVPSSAAGTISADGLNYTFFIRPNVKFHTGKTLTAEDVEYSIERYILLAPSGGPMWMLKEALYTAANAFSFLPYDTVIDPSITVDTAAQSVTFHLAEPFGPFLQIMAFWVGSVIDKDYAMANGDWDGTAADGEARYNSFNTFWNDNLVGTGPYKFVRWDRRQQVIMQRFDDYWGGAFTGETRRAANLEWIISKLVEEFSTRKLLLLSGDVDLAGIDIQFKDQFLGNADLTIFEGLKRLSASPFFTFNQRINATYAAAFVGNLPTVYPEAMDGEWLTWFGNKSLRLAFASAFDADAYIDEILKGNAARLASPIPEGMIGFDPTDPAPIPFDLDAAEAYFKEAWIDGSGDSVWERGFDFDYMYNTGNIGRESMGEQLADAIVTLNARRATQGITTPFKLEVAGQPWGSVYIPALLSWGLTMFSLGWIADYADPHNFVFPFLHSGGDFGYFININNSTLDDMITAAVLETDPDVRADMYKEIAISARDNAYYGALIQGYLFRVQRTWLKGWYFNPMVLDYVWAMDKF